MRERAMKAETDRSNVMKDALERILYMGSFYKTFGAQAESGTTDAAPSIEALHQADSEKVLRLWEYVEASVRFVEALQSGTVGDAEQQAYERALKRVQESEEEDET